MTLACKGMIFCVGYGMFAIGFGAAWFIFSRGCGHDQD